MVTFFDQFSSQQMSLLSRLFARISCRSSTIADSAIPPVPVDFDDLPPPPPSSDGVTDPSNLVVDLDEADADYSITPIKLALKESLPRVTLQLGGLKTREKSVEVLLDTASSITLIIADRAMYPTPATTPPLPDRQFGFIDRPNRFRMRGTAQDTAAIRSGSGGYSFAFPATVGLTDTADPVLGFGLLGAGPTSDFARSAGLFAYSVKVGRRTDSAVLLVKVPRPGAIEGFHCRNGHLTWVPLLSSNSWTVAGELGVTGSSIPTDFTIDTGASGLFLPRTMFEILSLAINGTSAKVSASPLPLAGGRASHLVYDCSRVLSSTLVSISVSLGADFRTTLEPKDFLGRTTEPDTCFLNAVIWERNQILLGGSFLRGNTVAFDKANGRLGFCEANLPDQV